MNDCLKDRLYLVRVAQLIVKMDFDFAVQLPDLIMLNL